MELKTKQDVMRAVNEIIEILMWCDDEYFVEVVTSAIVNGDSFTDKEIEEFA